MKLIIYCDGASRGNPGAAGAGASLKNEEGTEVAAVRKFLGQRATNNEAEYTGAIIGLEKALALGARHVALRADSQLMVRQLTGEYTVKAAHLRPLHQRVRSLLSKLDGWEAEHVPREQNSRADALANEAIDGRGEASSDPPTRPLECVGDHRCDGEPASQEQWPELPEPK